MRASQRMAALWIIWLVCSLGIARADTPAANSIQIPAMLCMSGDEQPFGQSTFEGIQLAFEEANAQHGAPLLKLKVYDEKSDVESAKQVAQQVADSDAPFVLGSVFSYLSLVEGPIFAQGGIASLATATSDLITRNPTTFRVLFKNSDEGELLATYADRVLHLKHVAVISTDDGYGSTLRAGFEAAATRLGLQATYRSFKTDEQAEQAARAVVADPAKPPTVLLMLDGPGSHVLPILRRGGITAPILGGDSFGDENLATRVADQPEEKQHPGSLTDGMYGIAPIVLDSANAEMLAFADRFKSRYGHDPTWNATAGYDIGQLAAAAIQATAHDASGTTAERRAASIAYLKSLSSPATAVPGILGPIWFDAGRGRIQAMRMARFDGGHLASAPLQIVPVETPNPAEVESGAVFEMSPGRYARIQRVVYTGIYLNEVPRIDLAQSSFGADFYLWLRYANEAGPGASDPTDLIFPNMVSGSFDRAHPAEERLTADGTTYRLWRVRGTYRNDYDLRLFPFDQQRLTLSLFNSRAAFERIVYALDRSSSSIAAQVAARSQTASASPIAAHAMEPASRTGFAIAAPQAFRELTQWQPVAAQELRDNLVTDSDLGDPTRIGQVSTRELSGFQVNVDVHRRVFATLTKSLLPLFLMTIIMFASLYFPHGLVKEKITVAITGALSGAVLLTAINAQLGGVGYTVAVEYAFYVFFGLSTICIVSVLLAERLRVAGQHRVAVRTEQITRVMFLFGVAAVVIGAAALLR